MNIRIIPKRGKNHCCACNKKLGLGAGRYTTADGVLCVECYDRQTSTNSQLLRDAYYKISDNTILFA